MTVQELIEELKKFPKDLEVFCNHTPFADLSISEVKNRDNEVVLLEIKSVT
jgi:hypothetical protein